MDSISTWCGLHTSAHGVHGNVWGSVKYSDNATLPPAVRMAATRGRAMLNKYYGLTDDSMVYRIAMCMFISAFGVRL
jgi:hypothetical protein